MKKKSKSKEAKFFCESCGSEVPRNSKTCPMCGKFFASVRCPQCGRIGSNDDFKNGCPTCGYAVNPDDGFGHSGGAVLVQDSAEAVKMLDTEAVDCWDLEENHLLNKAVM